MYVFKMYYYFSMHVSQKILIPNIIAAFIYSITISGCTKKLQDESTPEAHKNSYFGRLAAIIIAIPLIMFFSVFIREYYYIHNSDILIAFYYDYDSHTIFGEDNSGWYAYAINDSYCKKSRFWRCFLNREINAARYGSNCGGRFIVRKIKRIFGNSI